MTRMIAGIHRSRVSRFNDYDLAVRNSNHTLKISMIILGDDGKYWVVLMADAKRLMDQGYQLAA